MTNPHLPFQRRLAESTTERRIEKQRIIPEPVPPARRFHNPALHFPAKSLDQFARAPQRHHRNKPRCAILYALHPIQQQSVIGGIVGFRTRESRRVNARSPSQSVYLQPRVIYKQVFFTIFRIIQSFLDCILFECCASFFGRRDGRQTRQRFYFECACQSQPEFAEFSGIGSRTIQPQLYSPKACF